VEESAATREDEAKEAEGSGQGGPEIKVCVGLNLEAQRLRFVLV